MTDATINDPDDLVIAFNGPRGRTQLSFSNELLTGPIEKFVSHLQAAEFDFEPSRVEDLREYLIGRRNGNGDVLANYEFRQPKMNSAHPERVMSVSPKVMPPTEIQLKATAPIGDGRPLTLNEARRALIDTVEVNYDGNKSIANAVLETAEETRCGRLFVVEGLSDDVLRTRFVDAREALKNGVLRAPYHHTFILMTFEDSPSVFLLGASDEAALDDEDQVSGIWFATPEKLADGSVIWRTPSKLRAVDGEEANPAEVLAPCTITILSLIADSRSPITRVTADEKLNKARLKRGAAPIPPYWKVEAPRPTVLVPSATPRPATAKGGTHASPRPHDRRGHPRRLKDDRTVWVRDTKVNALVPHLTRTREFYEVRCG